MNEYKCPCCDVLSLRERGLWETCGNCWWEDDPLLSDDPNYKGGGMKMSLNEAREAYKKGVKVT